MELDVDEKGGITMGLRNDASKIIAEAIRNVQPDIAVRNALKNANFPERLYLIAVGKAAWQMAQAAWEILGARIADGIVITKYKHSKGPIGSLQIFEAGHPVPDENSFEVTKAVVNLVEPLRDGNLVIFLLSGGGSALFELPLLPEEELADITKQLLACGANIVEINTIRKRLSAVKGGRFAELCAPAHVYTVVLSDVVGDRLDMIASGPAYPDSSTCADAEEIAHRYGLKLSERAWTLLRQETPKSLDNVETVITGSVRQLCASAEQTTRKLGYDPVILTTSMTCTARDAGSFLASIARQYANSEKSLAFIAGGETVVQLTGHGLGGRNQELALSAAEGIAGLENVAVFSIGFDGTDGPTDAAGGYVNGRTASVLREKGISIPQALRENDSYHALQACNGLIMTGPTGTNVNDLAVVLIQEKERSSRTWCD